MSEKVILELPEAIAQHAREASERTGRSFEMILIDWLGRSATNADVYPLIPDAEYIIETPYGNEAAAKTLMNFLDSSGDSD
ncbi:MAG: hypothetical protein Q9P01_02945 [Anaerolineae bacterium]|nr:hypothetical protein [Anaerolineae bacterium]